jgi:hypothetical protein
MTVHYLILLIFLALFAYRVTRLVTLDSLFDKQRERWLDRFPPDGQRAAVQVDWSKWDQRPKGGAFMTPRTEPRKVSHLGEWVQCPWCCGFAVSCAVVGVTWWVLGSLPLPALWFGAVPCLVGFLGEIDAKTVNA